eukprot:scaffold602_cov342-Prasinococcus_capsulatus_cf.AAC.13
MRAPGADARALPQAVPVPLLPGLCGGAADHPSVRLPRGALGDRQRTHRALPGQQDGHGACTALYPAASSASRPTLHVVPARRCTTCWPWRVVAARSRWRRRCRWRCSTMPAHRREWWTLLRRRRRATGRAPPRASSTARRGAF